MIFSYYLNLFNMNFLNLGIDYHTLSIPGDLYESSYIFPNLVVFFGSYIYIYVCVCVCVCIWSFTLKCI